MKDTYESPLASRYASREMLYIFSPDKKFTTWRRLWIALARAEKELGLPITQGQIDELEREKDHINYDLAQEKERELRHDVMAHIHAYGAQCPKCHAHPPPGGHQLLRGGQHRYHFNERGPDPPPGQTGTGPGSPGPVCPPVQGHAHPGLYPLSRPPSWSPWASGPPCG